VRSGDGWREVYEVEPTGAEVERQLEQLRRLLVADPTHLDSHQHIHLDEPVRSVLRELGARLGVPARELTEDVRSVGDFDGEPDDEAISAAGLTRLLGTCRRARRRSAATRATPAGVRKSVSLTVKFSLRAWEHPLGNAPAVSPESCICPPLE
jgi:hypothetical protein